MKTNTAVTAAVTQDALVGMKGGREGARRVPGLGVRVSKHPGFFKRSMKPGAQWYFKFEFRGRAYRYATGTHLLDVARRKAVVFREETMERVKQGLPAVAERFRVRSGVPCLAECRVAYEEHIGREAVRAPKRASWTRYWQNLLALLRVALGNERVALSGVSASALAGEAGAELVKDFRERWLGGEERSAAGMQSRRRSGDSMLRQARACFSPEALRCYRAFAMPDLSGFMKAAGLGSVAPSHGEIRPDVLRGMAAGIAAESPAMQIVHLCHKFLGLRNSEIAEARVGWFWPMTFVDGRPVQWLLEISAERCGYTPKASKGRVPLCGAVAAELVRLWALAGVDPEDKEAFVVPAAGVTARHDLVYKEHAAFVRRFLTDEDFSKAGYELRRWAYRAMFAKTAGNETAAGAFLRHAPAAGAQRFYKDGFYQWSVLGDDVGITLEEARDGVPALGGEAAPGWTWAGLLGR